MRFSSIMLASHGFAALGAGAAAWALPHLVQVDPALATLCGLPVALGVGLAVAYKAGGELVRLGDSVADNDLRSGFKSKLHEIQGLSRKLAQYAHRWEARTAQAMEQAREVEELLLRMNRGPRDDHEGGPGQQLRRLLMTLTNAATVDLSQVLNSVQEIERRTHEMASGAEEQADAVAKTTTFVEQMSANIDSVSQNADAASKAAEAAKESAAGGLELMRDLIRGMQRIRMHVEAGGKKLRTLGERSQEIGSIVETIATISARTDMLALNASIESVRAGEHGRGFAVVAEEVRKLAEQAAQATREVSGLIESVQMETQEFIAAMADERTQVEEEVRRVSDAGVALERISDTSSDSARRVGEISRATLNQLRFTQEVVLAMERISEVARGIRSRADGVCGTTKTLNQLAQELNNSLVPLRLCADDHTGHVTRRQGGDDLRTTTPLPLGSMLQPGTGLPLYSDPAAV